MSAVFTKGPWNVQSDGQIWCDDHPIIEKMCRGPWGDEATNAVTGEHMLVHHWGTVAVDEAKANASLIAAAPDLYAALKAIGYWPSVRAAIGDKLSAQLDAAVAKAEGQQ